MTRKITWFIAGCLLALSLALVSCATSPAAAPTSAAPAAATSAPGAAPTSPSAASTTAPAASPSAAAEKPKYGGTLNLYLTTDPLSFDPGLVAHFFVPTLYLTNDELLYGDWTKGPAGTDQFTYIYGSNSGLDSKIGALAESWKIAEPGHMVFNIRHGVHFGLNPNSAASKLVNGRELTADDVAFSINRAIKEDKYIRGSAPDMVAHTTVTTPDKWTVDIKTPVADSLWVLTYLAMGQNIIPPEVVQKYGDIKDWKNSVGTGPFMLTNYVSGSQAAFVKNPNFWDKNPIGPGKGDKLPYLDGVNVLILPDPSTRLTAIRTGKIDWMGGVPALVKDDFTSLMGTSPKLQSKRYFANGAQLIYMRTDLQDQPFKDPKVRQALTMAIDYKTIVSKLLNGDAEYPGFPMPDAPDFKSIYFPLSQAPKAVQDIYTYNPTQAKQMLAQAGYPNGFKTSIIADSTGGIYTDQLSVIKDYWSKIGVDLSIQPMEFGAYTAEAQSRKYPQMMYGGSGSFGIYIRMINWNGGTQFNGSLIDDPTAKSTANEMALDMAKGDQTAADAAYKKFESYAMQQAWMIPYPTPYDYTVWWPWLKNYHGELAVGFDNGFVWTRYVWLDENLKKSMLGQ